MKPKLRLAFAIPMLLLLLAAGCKRETLTSGEDALASDEAARLQKRAAAATEVAYPHFVFAKILDTVPPIERGDKYEDPLHETLEARKLGQVTGGGSSLDKGKIEWVGVDIELANLDEALELARRRLRELGAPTGSVLEFKRDGKDVSVPVH